MKKKKNLFIMILCITLMASVMPVQARKNKNYWSKMSEKITAKAALLMDVDTGTILYKKNINEQYYPASITKILTTLIAVENSSMDEIVTFSEDSVYKTEGSGISRDVGEKMTMEECIYATMLESANECAYAIAEHIGGSMKKFVKMMNDKAKELGCTSSHFANPHGLTDKEHYVTAKDMAVIARAAYENETFRLICGTKRYTIPKTNKHKEPTYLLNHHNMLYPHDTTAYLYDYCTGGKTGYTVAAQNTLVTYAQKDDMTLLVVILSGSSPNYWNETRALFEYGFENFNLCNVAGYADTEELSSGEKYDSLNVNEPYAQIDPQAKIILPKTADLHDASMKISYENLPENALAQIKYTYGKHEIGTADIIRTNAVIDQNGVNNSEEEADEINNESDTVNTEDNTDDTKDNSKDSKEFSFGSLFTNIKEAFLSKIVIILVCIFAAALLIFIIFRIYFHRSYKVRRRIANYKSRKRESRQYTIIRDTRKTRGRRRRRRR